MSTQSETSHTAEEKTRDLRQEFSALPFERKIATLLELETVTATEAFEKIANASAALGQKIFDSILPDEPAEPAQRTPPEKEKAA